MTTLYGHRLLFGTGFLLVVAAVTYSCKDFLADAGTPQGTLDEGTLTTRLGVEGTLTAAYRMLDGSGVTGGWGAAASNWVWGSVASDDAYKGSDAGDIIEFTDVELGQWSTGGVANELNDKWRAVYEGVVRSNATLRLLDRVRTEKPDEISDADADGIRGEALFLRAHYHFEAYRMWGSNADGSPGGVPYYRDDAADFRQANTGVDAVTEIIQDLDDAIALLTTTPRRGEKGRATQWTAKAYKGRVQVYDRDYAGALTTLTEVKNSGVYALEANFHRVWTGFPEYGNGPETIWAFQASANDGEPNGNNANYGERLNFPYGGPIQACCGFHQPSQNLVNFFRVDAAGLPLPLSDPANWNANNANFVGGSTAPVDPRLDWTVGRDGVPYKDWGLHSSNPDWIRDRGFSGPYSPKKNVHEKASGAASTVGWTSAQLNWVNIHLYRYADLLLLLAEAEVEVGSLENARTIVNEIRRRAAVAAQGPGTDRATITVAINDPRITWATYQIGEYPTTGWTQAYAREAVRAERRLELAMEGQRFFDLRRWGTVEQVLDEYVLVEKTRRTYLAPADYAARHYRYPIPVLQIELSKVGNELRLQQNTGW